MNAIENAPASVELVEGAKDIQHPNYTTIDLAWPKLVSLDATTTPQSLPIELWPPILRDYINEAAAETETPKELSAMLALGVLASAVQSLANVRLRTHTEPLCLFIVVSLPPASRKSAEFKRALKPLVEWESNQRKIKFHEIKRANSMLATHKERVKKLRGVAAKEQDNSLAADLARQLADLEAKEPQIPTYPKAYTSDVTTEHLATLMNQNRESIALLSPEGGIFETMAGRYQHGVVNIDLYLQGHAGDAVRIDRGSKEPVSMDDPRLTVALTIQPAVLKSLSTKPGFKERGLIGRFLYVVPPSNLGTRKGNGELMKPATESKYSALITELQNAGYEAKHLQEVKLSKGAYSKWFEYSREIEAGLADGGRFEFCRDWAGKMAGAVARIAGLFHFARMGLKALNSEIQLQDMAAAISTGKALESHALSVFGIMGVNPDVESAKILVNWMQRKEIVEFTRRDAQQNHKPHFDKVPNLDQALTVLVEHGYIRKKHQPDIKPGRPLKLYEVNKKVLGFLG